MNFTAQNLYSKVLNTSEQYPEIFMFIQVSTSKQFENHLLKPLVEMHGSTTATTYHIMQCTE